MFVPLFISYIAFIGKMFCRLQENVPQTQTPPAVLAAQLAFTSLLVIFQALAPPPGKS